MRPSRDLPPPLGATVAGNGVDFAVYAGHADAVEIALFEPGDVTGASERRVPLRQRAHGTWFGTVPGIGAGQRYGVRAHGPWRPAEGLRYNADKLLLDPYARAVEGVVTWRPEVFGHVVNAQLHGDPDVRDSRDSAPYVPRAVVVEDRFDWGDDEPPQVPWADTVIYETHVKNLTQRHPGVPEALRGTYAGLAHPATLAHLRGLGVTSVELLPVHAFTHEPGLVQRDLVNHWGYNTLGFFAPQAALAASPDPQGVLDEFKGVVRLLHQAGMEVLLDVVYNHTCEQSVDGATLSWRGLDNRAYYRLDERGRDIDVTGCGNTLDLRHPMMCRMALDSLRYWVNECHVDGFRFDLAVALGRGRDDGYDPDHPFLVALRTDPVLSRVKLVAEPWDVGVHGWRTGQFPPPFGEWNDRFRDAVRTFWLPDVARSMRGEAGHGVRDLATRLAGSHDLFGARDRGPIASVNFVAAHDGFTLADTTTYEHKHNGANGEGNRDGSNDNRSWNHGVEGRSVEGRSVEGRSVEGRSVQGPGVEGRSVEGRATGGQGSEGQARQGSGRAASGSVVPGPVGSADDPAEGVPIAAARRRSMRNLLATILLSTGVPMLCGGDEFGRSQRGNNNAYCQDNEISWFDWDFEPWQEDLLETATFLTSLRAANPVLRQRHFFGLRPLDGDGAVGLQWFAADGEPMHNGLWDDARTRTLSMHLDGSDIGADSLFIVFHGGGHEGEVTLPELDGQTTYRLLWDSGWERPLLRRGGNAADEGVAPGTLKVAAASLLVYEVVRSLADPGTCEDVHGREGTRIDAS